MASLSSDAARTNSHERRRASASALCRTTSNITSFTGIIEHHLTVWGKASPLLTFRLQQPAGPRGVPSDLAASPTTCDNACVGHRGSEDRSHFARLA